MKKIHNYFTLFLASFLLLCLFIMVNLLYQHQSNRVHSLAMESVEVLAQWNELGASSYGLLVDRFTQFGTDPSPVFSDWEAACDEFEGDLEHLISNPGLDAQPKLRERLEGAYRVWRYTRVRLNTASEHIDRIVKSGLGERVFVNGMLHTMYELRMEGLLSVEEILLLDSMITALENFDKSSHEFGVLFEQIISDMKTEGETYLRRMRFLIFAIFSAALLVLLLSFYLHRTISRSQESRALLNSERRADLYRALLETGSREAIDALGTGREDLSVPIDPEAPLLPVMVQIDDYRQFSHTWNISEQQQIIDQLSGDLHDFFVQHVCPADHLRYHEDSLVFLINGPSEEVLYQLTAELGEWTRRHQEESDLSFSLTVGELCLEPEDIDQEFQGLLRTAAYRYTLGKGAFIHRGVVSCSQETEFKYPTDRERQFTEACKALDVESVLRISHSMIEYAASFGPDYAKRLILRLSAAQSSVIEQLERSFSIEEGTLGTTPRILEIQGKETLQEAEELLQTIIRTVLEACREKRSSKHDQVIDRIREMVSDRLTDYNLSADMIGDAFNLSASYINRVFKQQTSMSIAGYINDERLKRADELIAQGGITIADAAAAAGFASMGTFFRLYKKKFGQTPGERLSGIYGQA